MSARGERLPDQWEAEADEIEGVDLRAADVLRRCAAELRAELDRLRTPDQGGEAFTTPTAAETAAAALDRDTSALRALLTMHLRTHLADGAFRDYCPLCLERRRVGGTGVTPRGLWMFFSPVALDMAAAAIDVAVSMGRCGYGSDLAPTQVDER